MRMKNATHDERIAYLMGRALDLAAEWVAHGRPSDAERFGRVTSALARALGENLTALRDALIDDARAEAVR